MEKDNMLEVCLENIQNQLALSGAQLPADPSLLKLCSEMDSFAVDYQKLRHLDNQSFFHAAYICLLKRFPDPQAQENWKMRIAEMEKDEFQQSVLLTLLGSEESRIKRTYMVHCPYLIEQSIFSETIDLRVRLYNKYHYIYMKLPYFLRKFLKKMLRKFMLGSE